MPWPAANVEGQNAHFVILLATKRRNCVGRRGFWYISREFNTTSAGLPRKDETFLLRRRPWLAAILAGQILSGSGSQIEQVNAAILSMDGTTLCIQGPPGSGKTYTASHAIAALLKAGKVVGISSNSHKAIANLLDEAVKVASLDRVTFSAAKVQRNIDQFHVTSTGVQPCKSIADVFGAGLTSYNLVGGTAWVFSDAASQGQLDYLFVDEAGQVSIANLLGMAASTKNIVLLGDQMQLSQPIKGSHPGESGLSCLDYLLQDHQTIPEDFGIFLGMTHRMHPAVCKFISESVYEGRLHSEAFTANRVLVVPPAASGTITKPAGIIYHPVEHEGNSQESVEEVEAIVEIIDHLKKCSLLDERGESPRKVELDDILIVAPYNLQVRNLQAKLPAGKIGTVDKFQGQQAAIVIISMCSSDAGESARGLEFLLSKNRINVAISRAKTLAVIVGSPNLARAACSNVEQMELVNLFSQVVEEG